MTRYQFGYTLMEPPDGPVQDFIQARWLRSFLEHQHHTGRHRYRMLINAPHPITWKPTYIGCEKCGKPKP
jgi:hypothetical protein